METCWLVKSPKGDAVFLKGNEHRAVEYATKHDGILIEMYGETPSYSGSIRPARSITCQRDKQLQPDAPGASPVCEASKPT